MASLAEDVNVDELRRRARRRLVGAIVLALAAAVIVPMLLESDPKPLGEDVSVRIPPVDNGKFVNRLNDASTSSAAPAGDAKGGTAQEPAAAKPKYDTRIGSGSTAAPSTRATPESAPSATGATRAATESATPGTPAASPSSPSSAPPVASSTPAPASAARTNSGATTASKSNGNGTASSAAGNNSPAGKAAGGFAVQLAAFSDDKGANALAGRLRRAGYEAYTEPFKTSKGTLWRVRVGPFGSREAASAARDKLKGEGQNGIVASSR